MGVPVLILGQSGTGKSASLRNFKSDDVLVINVANKPLPFKNKIECISADRCVDIIDAMNDTKKKVIVIDDAQYIMSFQYMRRLQEKGWDKWNDIQGDFFNVINEVKNLPDDKIVYFLSHIDRDSEGYEKIKTMGKMLDEKITIEGLFTIVLKTHVADGQYNFLTQNNGKDTVKSPIGMFSSYAIDNDLNYVDEKIRNYYDFDNALPDEQIAALDEQVKNDAVTKETVEKKPRSRKSNKETTEEKKTRRSRAAKESEEKENEPNLVESGEDDLKDEDFVEEKKTRKSRSKEKVEPKELDEESETEPEQKPRTRKRRRA